MFYVKLYALIYRIRQNSLSLICEYYAGLCVEMYADVYIAGYKGICC